jgi:hypothetical protein
MVRCSSADGPGDPQPRGPVAARGRSDPIKARAASLADAAGATGEPRVADNHPGAAGFSSCDGTREPFFVTRTPCFVTRKASFVTRTPVS